MAKSKSQRHKEVIFKYLETRPKLNEDRFGNFVLESEVSDRKVRYHLKKTALNKQVRLEHGWVNVWSAYYKDIEIIDDKMTISKTIRG